MEWLRGQKFERPPIAVRVPDTMREVVAEMRAYSVLPQERLAARGRAWSDLGLGHSDAPGRLLRILAADLEGIGFEPQGNRLLVSPNRLTVEDFQPREGPHDPSTVLLMTGVRPDEPVVGHLLMHVRQRERAGRDPLEPTTDRLLAVMAWAEGEANLLAVRYLFEGMGLADEVMDLKMDPATLLGGALMPPANPELSAVETQLLGFIYDEGFIQAVNSYKAGGWKALDESMARRRTTRELLHPGAGPPEPFPDAGLPAMDGLRRIDEDSLGEQAIVVLISTLTGKDNLGLLAADGWAADRLLRFEREGDTSGEGQTEWLTRWSSAEEAADFEYAFGRLLAARFPEQQMEPGAQGERILRAGGRLFRTLRRERDFQVVIIPTAWEHALAGAPRPEKVSGTVSPRKGS